MLSNADKEFHNAQLIFLSELGLDIWQPKHKPTFIKNYSDTGFTRRIDAEYYQPKYDELINIIKNYSEGWDEFGNLVQLKDKKFSPEKNREYKYIELANIVRHGEIVGCMKDKVGNLPKRARRKVATGDVIVSSIEGSLSSIAMIEQEYNNALCSTGFHVINSESLNSETLLVLLKSTVGQLQLKKGCNGTILSAINQDEINKIILPKIKQKIQRRIQKKLLNP